MCRPALYFQSELLPFCAIFRKRRGWEARALDLGVPSSILATVFVLGSPEFKSTAHAWKIANWFAPYRMAILTMLHSTCIACFIKAPQGCRWISIYTLTSFLSWLSVTLSPALFLEPWFLFWARYHPLNCATILFIYVLHQLWRVLWILATLLRMSDFWGLGTP